MRALSRPVFLADRSIRHALVLGGTGFIGASLMRRLGTAGVRTTCLVHRTPLADRDVSVLHGSIDRFRWKTLEADPPDVIFHLARIAGRGPIRGPLTRVRNRVANERLVLALERWERPPLVIYVGGTLAYGSRGDDLVTEETPLAPTSFSRDYHTAEVPWLRALHAQATPVIVTRPAWVLGPDAWFEAYYRRFIQTEHAVPLYGRGDNWMSLVHVDDCAGQIAHAARHALPMSIVNVFGGPPIRQTELAERLSRLTRLPIRSVALDELERRSGRAVREAFEFSCRIGTVHEALHAAYRMEHQDLDTDLAALLRST
jgi:nucleoside-diphosphate-sugar epimerase